MVPSFSADPCGGTSQWSGGSGAPATASAEGMAIAKAKGKLRGKRPKLSEKQQKQLWQFHARYRGIFDQRSCRGLLRITADCLSNIEQAENCLTYDPDRGREPGCPGPPARIPAGALAHRAPALGVDGEALVGPRVSDGGFWPVHASQSLGFRPFGRVFLRPSAQRAKH